MDADAAPETEVPRAEDEGSPAEGEADDAGETSQPKGGKKKRTWQKVNNLYNPAPYTAQKGASKGSKGGGKGGKGGNEGEGSPKGKGKGKDTYGEAEAQKVQEDPGRAPAEGAGPAAMDGDAMQGKGAARSKKQGGKSRDGKGKGTGGGKAPPGAQRKGLGGLGAGPGVGPGAGPGGGPGAGPGAGPLPGAKGMPRGGAAPGEAPEPGADAPEGPRPPGPQRPLMPGKGGAGQGGGPGVPVAMAPYGYGAAVPYPCGAAFPAPYGGPMTAMYAMPYYMMPAPTPLNTGSTPYMPGGGGPAQSPNSPDRQNMKSQVQSQIEYYFGRENMIKDVYLRSRLMNEEGWVPIAPLANFRRIQSMTTDMGVIMDAIATSTKLEMDPQGQHVRLKENWQEWVLQNQSPAAGRQAASP